MTEGPFGGSSCQRRPNSSLFVVFLNIVHIIELLDDLRGFLVRCISADASSRALLRDSARKIYGTACVSHNELTGSNDWFLPA